MPDAIIQGSKWAGGLIGGLKGGRRVRGGWRWVGGEKTIAKRAPRYKDFAPERRSARVEVSEGTIREKEVARMEGIERVGAADPVEGNVFVGVDIWFK